MLEFLAHWECVLTQRERTVRKCNFRLPGKHISIYQNQKSPHSSFQEYVNQRPLDLVATLWSSTWASLTNSEKMDGEWLVKSWLVTHHNIVTVPNLRSANQRGMCSPPEACQKSCGRISNTLCALLSLDHSRKGSGNTDWILETESEIKEKGARKRESRNIKWRWQSLLGFRFHFFSYLLIFGYLLCNAQSWTQSLTHASQLFSQELKLLPTHMALKCMT